MSRARATEPPAPDAEATDSEAARPAGDDGVGETVVIPVTGELDLHAFAPRDIPGVVTDYVEACREVGVSELRLVHGRGRGVQRAVVRRVLLAMADVADVRDAPPGAGGWGATLARIEHRSAHADREIPRKPE